MKNKLLALLLLVIPFPQTTTELARGLHDITDQARLTRTSGAPARFLSGADASRSAAALTGVASQATTPVSVRAKGPAIPVQPGYEFVILVVFDIAPGWHIYAENPGDAGRPTTIDVTLPDGFALKSIKWPDPLKFEDSGFTTFGYEGRTEVEITVERIKNGANTDECLLGITWLACRDACVPGKTELSVPLAAAQAIPATPGAGNSPSAGFPEDSSGMSLIGYLALAFIGGLLLNLMPCVLPVLALKLMRFVKEANESRSVIFRLGLAYAAGTISTCLALASVVIVAQLFGASIGWGFQFQQPLFLIFLATLVTLMSLGMFGMFMIQVPAGQGLANLSARKGLAGAFFTGVLATVLSTPCTAPFLGTAVGFAFSESWWVILAIFFSVGLGLSAPYVVLTLNPAWLKLIPKPGAWMEHLKEAMAFSLLASVVWLLWIIGRQTGVAGLTATLVFLLCASFSAWLVSRFALFETRRLRKASAFIAALAIALSGFFLSVGPTLSGNTHQAGAATANGHEPYSPEALARHLKDGKVVLVDFTADWCLTCKVNETTVLADKEVKDALKRLDVVVLTADWTLGDAAITAALNEHGRSGVPLYLVYSPNRPDQPVFLPEILTKSIVLKAVSEARLP